MKVLDFLKKKAKQVKESERPASDIPPAPPTADELPEIPEEPEESEIMEKAAEKPPEQILEDIEQAAVEEQQEVLDHREELVVRKPLFIHLDQFKDLLDEVTSIKNIVKENKDILARVSEFKEDEDSEFKKWEIQIRDVQKKLIYADKTLFGARG